MTEGSRSRRSSERGAFLGTPATEWEDSFRGDRSSGGVSRSSVGGCGGCGGVVCFFAVESSRSRDGCHGSRDTRTKKPRTTCWFALERFIDGSFYSSYPMEARQILLHASSRLGRPGPGRVIKSRLRVLSQQISSSTGGCPTLHPEAYLAAETE